MDAVLGIDPGKKGAMTLIHTDGIIVVDWSERYFDALIEFTLRYTIRLCAIESQVYMPDDAKGALKTSFTNYGRYIGCMESHQIPFVEVRPQVWQDFHRVTKGQEKKARKLQICLMAERKWPDTEFRGPKGGIKDGRSDSAFIADWCRLAA